MVLLVGGLGAIQELEVNTKCWIQILRMYLTTSYTLIFSVYFEIQFWLKGVLEKQFAKPSKVAIWAQKAWRNLREDLPTSRPSIVCGIDHKQTIDRVWD
jgi:hypothetical protein